MPGEPIDPLNDSLPLTIEIPPSPHRVHIILHPDRIQTLILDIPDHDYTCTTVPHIRMFTQPPQLF